jgi:hypothetical protein
MSKIDNGGPAFPIPCDDRPHAYEAHPGMTLRDWFAGQALIGLLAGHYSETNRLNFTEVPREAYCIADAMIEARKVKP